MNDQQIIEAARRAFQSGETGFSAALHEDMREILYRVESGKPIDRWQYGVLVYVANQQIEIEKPARVTGAITW